MNTDSSFQKSFFKLRFIKLISVLLFFTIVFQGCIIYEYISLALDLKKMTGIIYYHNISSGVIKDEIDMKNAGQKQLFLADIENYRRQDLEELISDYKNKNHEEGIRILKKKLYIKNHQLNGKEIFKLDFLAAIDLSHVNHQILFRLDDDAEYVNSNGELLHTDTATYIAWDDKIRKIWCKFKPFDVDKDFCMTTSLLPYYKQYRKNKTGKK